MTRSGAELSVSVTLGPVLDGQGKVVGVTEIIRDIAESVAAREQLILSKERIDRLYRSTPAMMHSLDEEGFIISVSDKWLETLGYERPDVIGRRSTDFLTSQSAQYAKDVVLPAFMQSGSCKDVAYEMVSKGGKIVQVELSALLERHPDGSPLRTLAILEDVTEKTRAERALMKAAQLLERTGQIATVGGWEVDLLTGAIDWTKQTRRIHGVGDDYVPTLETAIEFYAPEARAVITAAVQQAIDTGAGWDLELRFIAADRTEKWVRALGEVEISNGKPVRLAGAFQDITRRIQRERELKDAHERMNIATENGGIGVWDADLQTGTTFYSEKWCALLGYSRQEISEATTTWLDFVHPDDRERALLADRDHLNGRSEYFEEQFRMRHKDGRWVWILDRGKIVERSPSGLPTRMIGTHTDITAQKIAEEHRLHLARRMELATDSGRIGIWEIELATGNVNWDAWMYRLWGEEDLTKSPRDVFSQSIHPEDRERIEAAVAAAIADGGDLDQEYRIVWPDTSIRNIKVAARISHSAAGAPERLIGAAWDVTRERRMAEELQERAELMRVTLQSIGDAVITTDRHGCVEWLNPAAEHMTGWSARDAKGRHIATVFNIVHEETRQTAPNPVMACLKTLQVVGLDENTALLSKDGREFAIEDSAAPIRAEDGHVLGAVMVFHDVSEQRRLSREMRYRASHDALTGLVNRAEFDRRLRAAYDSVGEERQSGALLYIDLDRFKAVNDSCGHAAGDQLLRTVSKMISDNVRSGDTVARLGGDEFAIILEGCAVHNAIAIGQNICNEMDTYRFVHDGKRFRVGTSIGVAPLDPELGSLATLQQGADAACFVAKEEGRNRVHLWAADDRSTAEHSNRLNWAAKIEDALDYDRFELFAQQIVPLRKKGLEDRCEILLRLRDEAGQLISPAVFMPAVERFNLAGRVDRLVLKKTIDMISHTGNGVTQATICVNLSGQSIGDRSFHRDASDLLNRTPQEVRQRLCLEITETAAITNMADAIQFASQVRQLGVSIALDDFGAGTSSFGYLRHLPADVLKIDGQFIQGLLDDKLQEATVRSFIEAGRIMNLKIVAEYVSNKELAEKVTRLGVDYGQGFYFHQPEPFADWLYREACLKQGLQV